MNWAWQSLPDIAIAVIGGIISIALVEFLRRISGRLSVNSSVSILALPHLSQCLQGKLRER